MPADDPTQPDESLQAPRDGSNAPDDAGGEEPLTGRLSRVVALLEARLDDGPKLVGWFAGWLPLIDALRGLAATAAELARRAPEASAAADRPLFDEQVRADLEERVHRLMEEFPGVSEIFFGIDNVDAAIEQTLDDEVSRSAAVELARKVEARLDRGIARLVEWALEDGGPELNVERLEAFVRGLESLLQEVLDRWVLPALYGHFDNGEDDH